MTVIQDTPAEPIDLASGRENLPSTLRVGDDVELTFKAEGRPYEPVTLPARVRGALTGDPVDGGVAAVYLRLTGVPDDLPLPVEEGDTVRVEPRDAEYYGTYDDYDADEYVTVDGGLVYRMGLMDKFSPRAIVGRDVSIRLK